MTNVTVTASGTGTSTNYGVFNGTSSPTMTNVITTASGGTNNYGVNNSNSSPKMTNVTAVASGGDGNYGVHNFSSSPTMINVTATASGGPGDNYGVCISSANAFIDHSVLSGDDSAVHNFSASGVTTYISNTRLTGGVSGTVWTKCAGVYDGDFTFYDNTCP